MPIDKTDADRFFTLYAAALSTHDAAEISRHWDVPALVLGDQGVIPVARTDEILAFFTASMGQYAHIAKAEATIKSATVLSTNTIACEIEWAHLDQAGQQVGSEAGHYILRSAGDGLKIHVYTPKL